jgi:transmembrane sensor
MEQTKKDFSEQEIAKYLAGELSKKELVEIEEWINKDPGNEKKFLEFKWIWELTGQVKESKSIDIELARSKVIKKLHGFGRQKNFLTFITKVAAILFLPLLITSLVYLFYTRSSAGIQEFYSEINVSYGTVTQFVLSDGTNVWLNSGSHFEYPTQFTGASREVYLEGEAYFEVAESRKPFVVRTRQIEVVAEGTSFNVLAYPDDDRILTTLVEGEVTLYKLIPDSKPVIMTELKPNEKATYLPVKNEVTVSITDAEKYISWKEGKLIFNNDSFEEIVRKLGRWYNTDIRLIDPELRTYSYTATFTDETLLQVLELLEKSAPITYTYSQRTKNQDGTFTKRQVEIRIKK